MNFNLNPDFLKTKKVILKFTQLKEQTGLKRQKTYIKVMRKFFHQLKLSLNLVGNEKTDE